MRRSLKGGPRHLTLRKLQRGFISIGLKGIGPAFDGQKSNPIDELFRQGEPGAVFIAQKPSDLYARRNLLGYTEQFDNAYWTKTRTSVTANSTLSPVGTVTGDTLTADGTAGSHSILSTAVAVFAGDNTTSIILKAGTNNFAQIYFTGDTTSYVNFDLSTGTVGTSAGTATGSIVAATNGGYRCTVVNTASLAVTAVGVAIVSSASVARLESNSLATTIILWGAQLERASTASAYQRITDFTTEFQYRGVDYTRRNLLTYSQAFGNAAWSTTNATKTSTLATAPDNTATALALDLQATLSARVEQSFTANGTSAYRFSAYMRADTAMNVRYGPISGGTAVTLTTEWVRYEVSLGTPVAGAANYGVRGPAADPVAGTVYIWGAQLEPGSITSDYQAVTDGSEFIPIVNPLITQWTDNLGTTPVTDLEQTIGLQQDVRPIFFGPNLRSTGTTYLQGAPASAASYDTATGLGVAYRTDTTNQSWVEILVTTGKEYSVTVSVDAGSLQQLTIRRGTSGAGKDGVSIGNYAPGSTTTLTVSAAVAGTCIAFLCGGAASATFTVTRVSEVIASPNVVGTPLYGADIKVAGVVGLIGAATAATYNTGTGAGAATRVDAANQSYVTFANLPAQTFHAVQITNTGAAGLTIYRGTPAGTSLTTLAAGASTTARLSTDTGSALSIAPTGAATIGFTVTAIRPLYGNHRTQATSTARAKLTAKYNLFTLTDDFDNAAWTKSSCAVTTMGLAGPYGASNGSLITFTANGGNGISRTAGLAALSTATGNKMHVALKYSSWRWFEITTVKSAVATRSWIDLLNGVAGFAAHTGFTVTALANGWCIVSFTLSTAGLDEWYVTPRDSNGPGAGAATTNNGTTFYLSAFDMRLSCYAHSGLPAYQRVWDSTTGYDDAGFPAQWLLDGTSNGYETGAIDFSASDKLQMFAAVANQASADARIMELLDSWTTSGGALLGTQANAYTFGTTGTTSGPAFYNPTVATPNLRVLSSQLNNGAAGIANQITPRINGVLNQSSGSGTPTDAGNFANGVVNYYAVNNAASGFFSGGAYIDIIRGGATPSATLIAQVEQTCARYPQLTF